MSHSVLDPSALISSLPSLLPESAKDLSSPQDGIAALLHTAMSALAFRLVAIDDTAPADTSLSSVLPTEWNRNGPGNYTFRYRHDQSSLEFVMKVAKLGTRTLVNAIAVESDKAALLDICTADFVSPSFYPHNLSAADAAPLVHGFISSNRIADLMSQFKLKIVQKLMPGLRKDGYAEESNDVPASAGQRSNASQSRYQPPAGPRPEAPPHAPDSFSYNQPAYPRNPLEIGRRDLDPFPDPFSPPSLFPRGDGMIPGPDHPIFGGRGGLGGAFGTQGPWGGDGYLPPMGAPPGARFDPVGPGLGPLGGGIRGPGRRGPPGGGNLRGPDNDEFMPPGAQGDMFM